MDLKVFLKNLPAFEDFNSSLLDILAERLRVEDHEDGHVFIRQGEQGEALYLLMHGSVSIFRREEEKEFKVRELRDGELFGILSLVGELPASATCIAHGPAQTAALTREAFENLFRDASPIGRHLQFMIAGQMARDLREANRAQRDLMTGG